MAEILYPHKSGIGLMEPIAVIGHNVCIIYGSVKNWRRIIYLEPIPPFQCLDIGAILARTTSPRTQCRNLELLDNEFGQFRWFPIDNVEVTLWLPQVDGRFALRNIQVPVDAKITSRDPCLHLTEFFVWEDYSPWFEATNFMDYAITQARIVALGYRYVTTEIGSEVIQKIESGQEPCTYVVASGSSGIPR
jgi:hypothetical protein